MPLIDCFGRYQLSYKIMFRRFFVENFDLSKSKIEQIIRNASFKDKHILHRVYLLTCIYFHFPSINDQMPTSYQLTHTVFNLNFVLP